MSDLTFHHRKNIRSDISGQMGGQNVQILSENGRWAAMASRKASKVAKGAGNGGGAGAQVVSCTTQAMTEPVWQRASLASMVAAVESVLGRLNLGAAVCAGWTCKGRCSQCHPLSNVGGGCLQLDPRLGWRPFKAQRGRRSQRPLSVWCVGESRQPDGRFG